MLFPVNGLCNRRREQLLGVGARNIQEVAQKYLVGKIEKREMAIAVLGEKKEWVRPEDHWDTFPLSIEPESSMEKVKL